MRVAFKIAVLVAVACAALAAYRPEDFAIVAAWAALLCIAVFAAPSTGCGGR
jgi:hypothetical protein